MGQNAMQIADWQRRQGRVLTGEEPEDFGAEGKDKVAQTLP